jgi:hypothetical protein
LHQQKPAETENIVEGKVGTAMFLGEYLDCTVEMGQTILQTHQAHSVQVRRGDGIWVELPSAECMALPAD